MNKLVVAMGVAVVVLYAPLFLFADTANDGVEEAVRAYFPHVPVMAEIARCESMFRQFDSSGTPLPGGTGGNMIGVFQVNAPVHAAYARELGMDIYTLEGNFAYAKYLYENEGTRPWRSSSKCWGSAAKALESETAEIARLQALLIE